ncbi:hypothetical protein ACN38_g12012, partial [Penicillium nordicum]
GYINPCIISFTN